jgi:hypothetical protein
MDIEASEIVEIIDTATNGSWVMKELEKRLKELTTKLDNLDTRLIDLKNDISDLPSLVKQED